MERNKKHDIYLFSEQMIVATFNNIAHQTVLDLQFLIYLPCIYQKLFDDTTLKPDLVSLPLTYINSCAIVNNRCIKLRY